MHSVLDLARNCNIKIVISSRPIQPCVQAFSRIPKLYLQDLTAGDIKTDIEQTIDSHPHMVILRRKYPNEMKKLKNSLIDKVYGGISLGGSGMSISPGGARQFRPSL